ncbi:binary toxin-like calcium binding domain-containing protein [Fusibacter sp. JL216-2]|uniref:binary toxin-like calcium binding domain-containing protein n=1 Tax=Fusibacter sp. JL216-2 TaxID=3071453 RepID=UPI003D330059
MIRKLQRFVIALLVICLMVPQVSLAQMNFAESKAGQAAIENSEIRNGFEVKYYESVDIVGLESIGLNQPNDKSKGSWLMLGKLKENENLKAARFHGLVDPTDAVNELNAAIETNTVQSAAQYEVTTGSAIEAALNDMFDGESETNNLLIGTNQNDKIRMYVDGQLIVDRSNDERAMDYLRPVQVNRDPETGQVKPLDIVIDYYVVGSTSVPDSVNLMYAIPNSNGRVSINYFSLNDIMPPKYEEGIDVFEPIGLNGKMLITGLSDDLDGDGIPNHWESNGYTWDSTTLTLEPWDDEKHSENLGFVKYQTSPIQYSTDMDPYSDYAEVTGIRMDPAVTNAGKHPLVPAYPRIKVYMDSMDIIPQKGVTTKTGKDVTDTISNSVQQTETSSYEESHQESVGIKYGHEWSATPKSTFEISFNYTAGQKSTDTSATAITDSTSNSKSIKWEEATATDSNDAARLKLNLYYKNVGSAPISDVVPNVSLSQFGKAIATLKMPESASSEHITPGERYPNSGNLRVQYETDGRTPIKLDIDQLNNIMSKQAFELRTDQVQGKIRREGDNGVFENIGDWKAQIAKIDAVSADISLQLPGQDIKKAKIATRDSNDPSTRSNPKVTLEDAILIAFGGTTNGRDIYIDGHKMESGWMVSMSAETQDEVKRQMESMIYPCLFDIELKPNMNIMLQKPDSSTSPIIEGAFLSEDGKSVSVYTRPSVYEIDNASANLELNGTKSTLTLVQSETDAKVWSAKINGQINTNYDSRVTVTDKNGGETTVALQIPYAYSPPVPEGLKYVADRQFMNQYKMGHEYDFIELLVHSRASDAEAIVLNGFVNSAVGPKMNFRIGNGEFKMGSSGELVKAQDENLNGYIGVKEVDKTLLQMLSMLEEIGFKVFNTRYVLDTSFARAVIDAKNLNISFLGSNLGDKVDCIQFFDFPESNKVTPKNSGFVFYEDPNYEGRAEGVNFNTNDYLAWCEENDNFKPSSAKFVNGYKPLHAPQHGFSSITTRDEIFANINSGRNIYNGVGVSNLFDLNVAPIEDEDPLSRLNLSMEGYFSKENENGTKLNILSNPPKIMLDAFGEQQSLNTQIEDAKAYIVKVTSDKISSDKITVTLNDAYDVNLGLSDTSGFGLASGAKFSPRHSETFILNVDPQHPDRIDVNVSLGSWNYVDDNSKVEIEVLGAYTSDGECYYSVFEQPYVLKNLDTNVTEPVTIALEGPKFVTKPKGYMIRVTANSASSDLLTLHIDEATIDLGTSATEDVNGLTSYGVDHSGLMFVPVDSTPYTLNAFTEFNEEFVDRGVYKLEMVGYYY